MPLEQIYFNRWRAAYFTPDTYRNAFRRPSPTGSGRSSSGEGEEGTSCGRGEGEEGRGGSGQEDGKGGREAQGRRDGARAEDQVVARSKAAVERCFECLALNTDPPAGEESPWIGCEHCDDRWACADPVCKAELDRHEVKCKERRIEQEAAHQAVVRNAPRAAAAPYAAPAKNKLCKDS